MIRKIVLVSEAPESYDRMAAESGGGGIPSCAAGDAKSSTFGAARRGKCCVGSLSWMWPSFSAEDADVLAGLSVQYPQLRMMVFASRGSQEETLHRVESYRQISIHSTALGDRTSPALILKVLTQAITPGARGSEGARPSVRGPPSAENQDAG